VVAVVLVAIAAAAVGGAWLIGAVAARIQGRRSRPDFRRRRRTGRGRSE
jgi:hypothetical protein